jgi:antitoxin YefM
MNTISVSEAKMKLSALVDSVKNTDEEVVITKNGRPVAVLVSPDEFDSWRETMEVRFDSNLMEEIKNGLESLKNRKASLYSLDELLPEL